MVPKPLAGSVLEENSPQQHLLFSLSPWAQGGRRGCENLGFGLGASCLALSACVPHRV